MLSLIHVNTHIWTSRLDGACCMYHQGSPRHGWPWRHRLQAPPGNGMYISMVTVSSLRILVSYTVLIEWKVFTSCLCIDCRHDLFLYWLQTPSISVLTADMTYFCIDCGHDLFLYWLRTRPVSVLTADTICFCIDCGHDLFLYWLRARSVSVLTAGTICFCIDCGHDLFLYWLRARSIFVLTADMVNAGSASAIWPLHSSRKF